MRDEQAMCCAYAGQEAGTGAWVDAPDVAAGDAVAVQQEQELLLDLRTIPADRRRAVVFACFSRLQPGQRLMLLHHHHATLLHYLLLAEAPRAFTWEYLQQGPALWRILIYRHAPSDAACMH